jgi:hypothetical protein
VPIYAKNSGGQLSYVGTVIATGSETGFHFAVNAVPQKLIIDPQMTLLCVAE